MRIIAFFFAAVSLFSFPCLAQTEKCADCGTGGWGEMDISCPNPIRVKKDFMSSLTELPEAKVDTSTDINDFREGYIKIHEMGFHDSPIPDSIKVFIYNYWAVDMQGQVYLMGVLG